MPDEGEAANVLVIVLDTVRARSSSIRGRDLTPTIATLGERGTVFERAIAPSPWSLPSHASMYTGKYPSEHGATHHHKYLVEEQTTLAEELSAAGYTCGLFTANVFLTDTFNMDRGFEEVQFVRGQRHQLFEEGLDPVRFLNERDHGAGVRRFAEIGSAIADGPVLKNAANALYFKAQEVLGSDEAEQTLAWDRESVAAARSFLDERARDGEPFFGMVNLVQAHGPWDYDPEKLRAIGVEPEDVAPERRWREVAGDSESLWAYAAGEVEFDDTDREILTHLYESWVHNADATAGRLLDILDETGLRDHTLVVLTADHGEAIATDGVHGHTVGVSEDIAHVPLVLDGPGIPDTTVETAVSLKEIYGTVLQYTGVRPDAVSLREGAVEDVALCEMLGIDPADIDEQYRESAAEFGRRRAIYTRDRYAERRYDTGETLGDEDLLDRLEEIVAGFEQPPGDTGGADIDGDVEGRLRELGYLG